MASRVCRPSSGEKPKKTPTGKATAVGRRETTTGSTESSAPRARDRQGVGFEDGANAAGARDLIRGIGQSVAQIHAGGGRPVSAEEHAEPHARFRSQIPIDTGGVETRGVDTGRTEVLYGCQSGRCRSVGF